MENYKKLLGLLQKKEDVLKNLQLFVTCVKQLNLELLAHLKAEENFVREPLKSLSLEAQKKLSNYKTHNFFNDNRC